jgi:hypothetical protein
LKPRNQYPWWIWIVWFIPIPSFLLPPIWVWIALFFAALVTMVWSLEGFDTAMIRDVGRVPLWDEIGFGRDRYWVTGR